ncbi:hypothetical protein P691DRAFT_784701 [Macrolepiota fuliginosa MF-IS2]|uniref:Uncharacterized protein n=1 Tax=Macrolepiota fuliginosa MF-IS2 TaxID=1400762 RepID=A0A9P5WW09_9AGAR|nr:hypothetical protein P691DRAFT_784701 [Macrolepiota fuliginosa MF-IS2]
MPAPHASGTMTPLTTTLVIYKNLQVQHHVRHDTQTHGGGMVLADHLNQTKLRMCLLRDSCRMEWRIRGDAGGSRQRETNLLSLGLELLLRLVALAMDDDLKPLSPQLSPGKQDHEIIQEYRQMSCPGQKSNPRPDSRGETAQRDILPPPDNGSSEAQSSTLGW